MALTIDKGWDEDKLAAHHIHKVLMRNRTKNGKISVHAIAGSYVVLLGMNLDADVITDLLGFAIERIDHTQGERKWLPNFLTFEALDTGGNYGPKHSSENSPIQEFLWGDYTVKENHTYKYRVIAMYGKPGALKPGDSVEVEVTTENQSENIHAIYFNRGAAVSQAYVRRFGSKPPNQVPNRAAYKWLSRGLEEALLKFIGQAKNQNWGLRVAFYEFNYLPIHNALRIAAESGAEVKIIFDGITNDENNPKLKNLEAIQIAGIEQLTIPRQNSHYIAHNRFIVLLKNGKPIAVWTGSTNLTEGGIFGQSNVGHLIRDPEVAAKYLAYWQTLSHDPEAKSLKNWTETHTPVLYGQANPDSIQRRETRRLLLNA